jgi:hypothetical protein
LPVPRAGITAAKLAYDPAGSVRTNRPEVADVAPAIVPFESRIAHTGTRPFPAAGSFAPVSFPLTTAGAAACAVGAARAASATAIKAARPSGFMWQRYTRSSASIKAG